MSDRLRLSVQYLLILTGISILVAGFSALNNIWRYAVQTGATYASTEGITGSSAAGTKDAPGIVPLESTSATASGAATAPLAGPVKIMIVGDSISHGASGDWTWRYRLWQHLAEDGIAGQIDFVGPRDTVIDPTAATWTENHLYNEPDFDNEHDASAGRKAADEKNTIAGLVSAYTPNVAGTTNILLINLGTNDLGLANMTGQQAANEMSQLITNARAANPNIKIVLSKITPTSTGGDYQTRWADYNNRIAAMATTSGLSPIVIADPTPGYDPAADTFDGVHPTPSGEYKIAAAFADALSGGYGLGSPYGPIPSAPAWPLATKSVWWSLPSDSSVSLGWEPVNGVAQYYVFMRQTGQGSFVKASPLVTGTSFTVGALVPGVAYEFAIGAVRGYVTGQLSVPVQVNTAPDPRTRPPQTDPAMPGTPSSGDRTRPAPTTPGMP